MCGISGIFAYAPDAPPVAREELLATREAMARRGPDGAGIWIAPHEKIGLANRRLAILDLSASGAQPMSTPDGRLWITFNGEIYNFRELRDGLEKRGQRFRSTGDTEVLLYLYLRHGPDMVRQLRGMFAFGIWDEREGALFLARDSFGIKPLYYSDSGGVLRFGSQVKALLAGKGIDDAPDPAGHVGFFLWGSVPEPFTTYRAIRALPAGCTMMVSSNGVRAPSRYFSVRDEILAAESDARAVSEEEARWRISEALYDSVQQHLVSDVPVGIFLSAGIDSSVLASTASEFLADRLCSITLGFRQFVGSERDETVLASRTAAALGAQHETRWIGKKDFDEQLERLLEAMDQPSIDGVNTYFVSRAAAQAGLKVALSGLGGDEFFGGYPSFRDVPRIERIPALGRRYPRAARWLRHVMTMATGRRLSPKYAGLAEYAGRTGGAYLLRRGLYMPWELHEVMDRDMAVQGEQELAALATVEESVRGIRNSRLRIAALELTWYMRNQLLRDADWAGMAHSVEIRVPFVDVRFFRAILPAVASGHPPSKAVLAKAPRKPLPRALVERAKTGFAVPIADWIRSTPSGRTRGVRGWARRVNRAPGVGYRVLALISDGFGGRGGIALYVRDLLASMSTHPACREIVALPRFMPDPPGTLPAKVSYRTDGLDSKLRFLSAFARALRYVRSADIVLCGHINLAPLALVAKWWTGGRILLCTFGIEAWRPPSGLVTKACLQQVDHFFAISSVTRQRFLSWSSTSSSGEILPNAIHLEWYAPGPKDARLLARYGLEGRKVLATVGRLSARERYKGFDEVIELMPQLLAAQPDLAYLIVGEGGDRLRLEQKVKSLGLEGRVVFTGYVAESEKADHYRLADAYVMPSQGEGFGFVLLEALACGIPALASKLDGGKDALRDGHLGVLVDPKDGEDLRRGILAVLSVPRGKVPEGLAYFSYPEFERRCHRMIAGFIYGAAPEARTTRN